MFELKNDQALDADTFVRRGGHWQPHTHWVVSLAEENEARFVQSLLDKYADHVETYAFSPWSDDTFVIELQFLETQIGERCNDEYLKAFRKGGVITNLKKSMKRQATRRLYKHRMYRLPDGELFWYYALWDGYGNLIGKVYDTTTGHLRNKVVNRTVLEESDLIPAGQEPWLPD